MSEIRQEFEVILSNIKGHQVCSRQTKIQKSLLFELMYQRMLLRKRDGRASLCDEYLKEHDEYLKKHDSKPKGFSKTMQRAIETMDQWLKAYYEQNKDSSIRFEIELEDFNLVAISVDGFGSKTPKILLSDIIQHLEQVQKSAQAAIELLKGKRKPEYVGETGLVMKDLVDSSEQAKQNYLAFKRRTA